MSRCREIVSDGTPWAEVKIEAATSMVETTWVVLLTAIEIDGRLNRLQEYLDVCGKQCDTRVMYGRG